MSKLRAIMSSLVQKLNRTSGTSGMLAFLFVLTNRGASRYLVLSSGALAFTYSPFDTPATASDGVILF
jgi:hypothetical protein